jgi:hypothetical protein
MSVCHRRLFVGSHQARDLLDAPTGQSAEAVEQAIDLARIAKSRARLTQQRLRLPDSRYQSVLQIVVVRDCAREQPGQA